jgi:hypothetical protein
MAFAVAIYPNCMLYGLFNTSTDCHKNRHKTIADFFAMANHCIVMAKRMHGVAGWHSLWPSTRTACCMACSILQQIATKIATHKTIADFFAMTDQCIVMAK